MDNDESPPELFISSDEDEKSELYENLYPGKFIYLKYYLNTCLYNFYQTAMFLKRVINLLIIN